MRNKLFNLIGILLVINSLVDAANPNYKKINPDLFGIFFEDINYAVDGGLYAELIQNRSFEYSPTDKKNWHPFTSWDYITEGFGYGSITLESNQPLNTNNQHYAVLKIEEVGLEGIGIKNAGFDGISVKAGDIYKFSVFIRIINGSKIPFKVKIIGEKDNLLGENSFIADSNEWNKYSLEITAKETFNKASLKILALEKGKVAIDMVSLFPSNTFQNRTNGLRADLAQTIANLHPKFMRFPGGCLVHGDGLDNMYRWKNTIGPIEQRIAQKNIWGYHQTVGIGYFEYFQFCEDIGAKPLPVVPAGVSCQNSGGTWRVGGTGQKGIPHAEMDTYIQEILDLIEWANGSKTTVWGAKRAAAGHPKPFNLEYIGIGNEDKITPVFEERFKQIYKIVKAKHPEITIIGTVGPAPKGEDFDLGWKLANELNIPIVDEHYYENPEWFIANHQRYDSYKRSQSKVYLGEYASRGNTLFNALAEAAFMTALERNGDVVTLASYAPLLAKKGFTQWNPDMIYFDNEQIIVTPNYYVQQLFSINSGDRYYKNVISFGNDTTITASCVENSKTGEVFLKIVNTGNVDKIVKINLSTFKNIGIATKTIIYGDKEAKNNFENPNNIIPISSAFKVVSKFGYSAKAMSLTVFKIEIQK